MKKLATQVSILGLLLCFGFTAQASIPSLQAITKKSDRYVVDGLVRGGEAAKAFSFRDLRWAYGQQKKIERLIFEFGDVKGESIKHRPGYFQANIDGKNQRILIEFSQVVGSALNQTELQKRIKKSPYIKSVKMIFDPEDSSLTISLSLKQKIKAEVFELPTKSMGGRLALDLVGI